MEEDTYPQRLLAEMLGPAALVSIGAGSVPATLIVGGDAPFTMAQLGTISLAFATAVIAMIYAIGHVSGFHINPAIALAPAATKKMPRRYVPGYIAAQSAGALLGALAIVEVLQVAEPATAEGAMS
jgi:glycerol uptake facilitator